MKVSDKMKYQDHLITQVVRVTNDQLWHIFYLIGKGQARRETYDRVPKEEALNVIEQMEKRSPSCVLSFL